VITTWTGIHRRNQLEAGRIFSLSRCTGDSDPARFERLTQHLEYPAIEFGQLIKKKYAVVGE
jgi:hypothetical protein